MQPTPQVAPSHLEVTSEGEYVTVRAHGASVRAIVQEIARQRGLVVVSREPLDQRVTLDIRRLPLSEALGRILRDESFLLAAIYEPPGARQSPTVTRKLWVFSRESGADGRASADVSLGDVLARPDSLHVDADELADSLSLAFGDSDANVRADAVSALGSTRGDPAAAALASAALSDAAPSVREEAAYALGEIGGETSLRALEQALADPEHDVREAAIGALASIGGDQSALALAVVLNDQDASLRAEAVDALGEIGGDTAIRLLQRVSADEESYIRESAVELLADLSE